MPQLPAKLCEILAYKHCDTMHVNDMLHGDEITDREIIDLAQLEGRIVITKDADFYHSHMTLGRPGKLLLVTTGNIQNRQLFTLFRAYIDLIEELFSRCSFIELSNEGLIAHE